MICFNSFEGIFQCQTKYKEIYQKSITDAEGFWSVLQTIYFGIKTNKNFKF